MLSTWVFHDCKTSGAGAQSSWVLFCELNVFFEILLGNERFSQLRAKCLL